MKRYIRPVRDFGDEAEAYWVEPYQTDGIKTGSYEVSPNLTTIYDAVVVFGKDTFPLTGTVLVHEKYDKDTLYETVCSSPLPYTSAVNPIFQNLDITTPHDFQPVRMTLESQHGCDSVITLMLRVNSSHLFTETDYICVSDTPYTWRGKKIYESGTFYDTLSTICCSCDSVYQLDLTVMPLPEIITDSHVGACEGAPVTLAATSMNCADITRETIHEGFNKVNGSESTNIANQMTTLTDFISNSSSYVYPVGTTAIKIGSSNNAGYITTKALDLSYDYTLTLMCKGNYNTSNPNNEYDAQLQILVNNVPVDTLIIPANKDNHGYEPFVVNLPAATSSSTIRLRTLTNIIPGNEWAEKRVLIDDILISDNTSCSYVWWRGETDTLSHESSVTVTPDVSAPTYQERYYVQATSALGCKAIDSVLVKNLLTPLDYSLEICANELPYIWYDTVFEEGTAMHGNYVFHRTSVHGCDSIVNLTLSIYETKRDTIYKDLLYDTISTTVPVCTDRTIGLQSTTTYYIPVSEYYNYSCSQQIFTPSEVGKEGIINSIAFNFASSNKMSRKNDVKIYLAHTDKSSFTGSYNWMSPSSMTLVYSGDLNCSKGWNEFALDQTFDYNGTDNLMVMVLDESGNMDGSSYSFYMTSSATYMCMYYQSATPWSMTGPGTRYNYRSNIRFNICSQDTAVIFDGKTFVVDDSGVYTYIDTVPGSTGCDSITVRYLIVEKPHEDEICDSTYKPDHTWKDNVEPYCWIYNGTSNCISGMTTDAYGYYEFPGKKTIDGFEIDTISYLKLTINPTSRDTDTVRLCIYEEPTLTTYEINGADLTISMTESYMTITNSVPGVVVDTIDAANGDFVFKMKTVKGCDSILSVHFDRVFVQRDTIFHNVPFDASATICENPTIGNHGSTTYSIPVNNYYRYSCSQQIFTPAEVGTSGVISEISFNYYSSSTMTAKNNVKIYLGHTNKSSFANTTDWINPSDMTLVYSGNLNCKKGWNTFALSNAFNYNGSDNLVVMIHDESNNSNGYYYFYYTSSSDYKCLYYYSNSYNWSPTLSASYGYRYRMQYRSDIRFQICNNPIEFADKTFQVFEPGTYTITDTVPGSNGCDSITTRILIVNPPHEDEICDSTFTTGLTWVDNVEPYCWHYNGVNNCISGKELDSYGYYEFSGKKTIDGVDVDTISYLKLTINPTYRDTNNLILCLSGNDTTITTYETGKHITIHISGTGETTVTVPTAYTDVTIETVKPGESMDTIYLRRTTVKGCDSIEVLYLEKAIMKSDTIYKDVLFDSSTISCGNHTIGEQNGNGSYFPLYNYYNYSCTQQIFTHDEIGTLGTIEKLSFNYADATQTSKLNDVYIYLGHTSKSSFSNKSDWISPSEMTLVYHGSLNCHNGWNEFTLTTPFDYNGTDNLILMMNDVSGGGWENYYRFYYTNTTDNKSLYYHSDNYPWSITTFTYDSYGILNRRSDIRFYGCSYPTAEFDGNTITYKEPGTYVVKDIVPGSNGCDSVVIRVLIVEKPHYDTICVEGLPTYTWHGSPLPANTDAAGYYEFPGQKTIDGHTVDTISYLKLDFYPSPDVTLVSASDVCLGTSATLSATVTTPTKADYTYQWSSVDGLNISPATTTTTVTSANTAATLPTNAACGSTYTATVTLTDGNGCKATDDATVTVKAPAKPTILTALTDDNLGCNPTVPTLTVSDFTVSDECDATATVKLESAESIADCQHTKVWTATYENACGQKADTVKVTYVWTVDTQVPVIATTAVSGDKGCNPSAEDIAAPVFTLEDNCDETTVVPAANIDDSGELTVGTCGRKRTWIAHYTDPCGNKAVNDTVEYTWTVDTEKPVISTTAESGDKGCNPSAEDIAAPVFTLEDNCDETTVVPAANIDDSGELTVGTCGRKRTWIAHYTDPCGNKAVNDTVEYTWTVDTQKPVIATTAVSGDKGCNPSAEDIAAPVFTLEDNCDATTVVPAANIDDSGELTVGTCGRKRTWIAHYTDPCGNKAVNDTVEYTWTVDVTKPVISVVTSSNPDGACNPTITAPTFKVTDNCAGEFALTTDSIIDGGIVNIGTCERSRTWTAHYTDPCDNKAADVSVTYTWIEDHDAPVIHTEAVSDHKGCNPTIVAPTFTVVDNCEGTFFLHADSVTTTGKTGTGCEKSQSWTAHYTDGCGNPATANTVTYYWTETTVPTIETDLTDQNLGCDPATITPPTPDDFTVTDECDPSASVTIVAGEEVVTGHTHKKTWTATYENVCHQVATPIPITYTWIVAPPTSIECPPDVTKTLAYGDCVMEIYPSEIGTPTVNAPADWPMTVSNDIPADNLYQEGETIITWTATDQTCGYPVSCQQKIIVVFPQCPDAVDCEGNVYHGVRIGCDCWTQTNLVSNCYGDANECVTSGNCDDPVPCVYEYESPLHPDVDENVEIFGKLYCDTAGVGDSIVNPHGHIRGICPEGWYLPTVEKYEDLFLYGDALKSPLYWTDGGGDNSTGFSWLPAGWYNGALERFEGMGSEGYFLAVEVTGTEIHTVVYSLVHDCDEVNRLEVHTGYGYSVRCVKEKE